LSSLGFQFCSPSIDVYHDKPIFEFWHTLKLLLLHYCALIVWKQGKTHTAFYFTHLLLQVLRKMYPQFGQLHNGVYMQQVFPNINMPNITVVTI
jgi:hypothetical protein